MLFKVILVFVVFLVVCAPLLFGERLRVRPEDAVKYTRRPRPPYKYKRWRGPKTDERINRMFAECIALMRELNVPISDSICHTVPGGLRHTGPWRKWARYVSEKTGYDIQRCGGDDVTPQDIKNLRGE